MQRHSYCCDNSHTHNSKFDGRSLHHQLPTTDNDKHVMMPGHTFHDSLRRSRRRTAAGWETTRVIRMGMLNCQFAIVVFIFQKKAPPGLRIKKADLRCLGAGF